MSKAIVFYRLPGTNEIVKREGKINSQLMPIDLISESEKDIFYISPFNAGSIAYACVLEHEINKFEVISYQRNNKNTYDSKTDFIQKVDAAIHEMKQFQQISKVVLARCKEFKIAEEIDVNAYFLNLCLKIGCKIYPPPQNPACYHLKSVNFSYLKNYLSLHQKIHPQQI